MVWGSVLGFPGGIVRGSRIESSGDCARGILRSAVAPTPRHRCPGFSPRGMDIDGNGVVWVALASGHLASFDRSKCTGPLNGPKATGRQCPEGWTLYQTPGPKFKNVTASGSADSHYYVWVDQFDTLGLGKNTPIITGNSSDSLVALVNGKFTILRVPYPMGFYAKGMDGRFDDPKTGWKGKGVWTTWGTRTPFHSETGKGRTLKWSTCKFDPIRWLTKNGPVVFVCGHVYPNSNAHATSPVWILNYLSEINVNRMCTLADKVQWWDTAELAEDFHALIFSRFEVCFPATA